MMEQNGAPLEIALPDGRRACHVPGTRPARYEIAGELSAIDVSIPPDLVATGWCWSGSFLYQPYPGREDGPGVGISTATYGVPDYADPTRSTCFDAARRLDALRAEHAVLRATRPVKRTKKAKAAPAVVEPEPEQMELELV